MQPLKLTKQVLFAIQDGESGRYESALLHACIGIDATAKKMFPNDRRVGNRYVACLRRYFWLIESMLVAGLNLEETRFTNVATTKLANPDFADLIYNVFRCCHAHGDEVPEEFSVRPTFGPYNSEWSFGAGSVQMPDRVVWALIAVAVLSKVNASLRSSGGSYFSLGDERFLVAEWWGREDEFRSIAARFNSGPRVTIEKLYRLTETARARGQL